MNSNRIEFVQNCVKHTNDNGDNFDDKNENFTVLLNGENDLENQLEEFKKACNVHTKIQRKSKKRRYYSLALMAEIVHCTTIDEVKRLLKNNARTFLIDLVKNKTQEVEALVDLVNQAKKDHQLEDPHNLLTVGVALRITGDCCRMGRNRNNCSLFLAKSNTITLTCNREYRYCGFKEIAYVINLEYYLPFIHLNDAISIGQEVKGTVIKKFKTCIAVSIEQAGIVNSYEYIEIPNQCKCLQPQTLADMFTQELEVAFRIQADFIAIPHIRCLPFLKALRHYIKNNYSFMLIGNIDFENVNVEMLDLLSLIKQLDFLWLTNLFSNNQTDYLYLLQNVIPLAKCLKVPIIGSVPLEDWRDFKSFENHEFLWKIDCMFISKSVWCNKYPLVVKKLLPIKNYRLTVTDNTMATHDILSSLESIVHFIIRTISSIECRAIFLYTKCKTPAIALARMEIYCPVFVMLPLDPTESGDIDEETKYRIKLCKSLNLRRNLRPILYTKDMNECEYNPLDYGIEYVRSCGCLETGDFIITLEVAKENGEDNVQLGIGEDVVIMRAFYIPPSKVGEKFKCY